jgi:CHAD domain-containing protein
MSIDRQDSAEPDQDESPTIWREVERKFRVGEDFQLPDLSCLAEVSEVRAQPALDLNAVYYDTTDLRLFRWRITLRRRSGGNDAGWHMKLPVQGESGHVRDEVRLPLSAGSEGHVPPGIARIVTALTRGKPLQPVTTIRNHRRPYLLVDANGEVSAELVDDRVSVIDDATVLSGFRELEVEALTREAEDSGVLPAVAAYLVSLGAVPGSTSKAASALGPRAGEPADVVDLPMPSPTGPAGQAIAALLAKHVRRMLLQDVRIRRDLPDSVHKMRVAARRIRSGLDAFRPLVEENWAKNLRRELKWIAGELSSLRDTEVLGERLHAAVTQLPPADSQRALNAIDSYLKSQHEQAKARAQIALESERYAILLEDLVDAARNPRLTPEAEASCADALPPLMKRAWQKLAADTKKLDIAGPPEPWHRTRKEAKKARYAAETLAPVFGTPGETLAEALEEVTEILGEHQDASVEQDALRSIASQADGPTGFSLGLLEAIAVEQGAALRERFETMWPRIDQVHQDISFQN